MSIRSRAVVFVEPTEVEIWEMDIPDPGPEDIIVKMLYSGISIGCEGWVLKGEKVESSHSPCISGYQQTGEVVEAGAKVRGIKVGDVVNLWNSQMPEQVHYEWGAHMEYAVQNYRNAVKVPTGVSPKVAALAKRFAVGNLGVNRTKIRKDDLIAVIGMGLVGQGYAQIARLKGARVIGTDIIPLRREIAAKFSCDKVVESSADALAKAVFAEKEGGADVVVEATGRTELIDDALNVVKDQGKVVWQGWYPGKVAFSFNPAHTKMVTMIFPYSLEGELDVLRLLAEKKLILEPLITHVFDFYDAPKAWDTLLNHPQEALGVVIKWS